MSIETHGRHVKAEIQDPTSGAGVGEGPRNLCFEETPSGANGVRSTLSDILRDKDPCKPQLQKAAHTSRKPGDSICCDQSVGVQRPVTTESLWIWPFSSDDQAQRLDLRGVTAAPFRGICEAYRKCVNKSTT